jgi:hypothetical protein
MAQVVPGAGIGRKGCVDRGAVGRRCGAVAGRLSVLTDLSHR